EKGLFPEMMAQLDQMVYTFTQEFNKVHSDGWSLSEISEGEKANGGLGIDFFTYARGTTEITEGSIKGAAQRLKVHDDIMRNLDHIAASGAATADGRATLGFSGDGSNALALANVKDASLSFGGAATTNVQSFYQGMI
ncbi:hypothetical protein, partial [Pseudomonas sp. 2995-3]|uniref:hypothetical protein n=1 Tax=Pseudomonas sp. 2995-3 TaxID=1712680 RepID=UPI001C496AE1